jgi:CBS domain-containing protein
MQAALVRRVPVANASGKLVGIVTLGDLTRATLGNPLLLPAVPEVARTLATVSSPRSAEASPRAA